MALKPRNNVFASPFLEGATFAGKYEFPEVAPVHIQHLSAIPYDKISRKLRENRLCGFTIMFSTLASSRC